MRKLVLQFYTSLDGYSSDEDNGMRDVMTAMDDADQESYFVQRLWQAGTHIMGRTSWENMAEFWPTSTHPSAAAMNDIPKVVFSRTLKSADQWPETRIAAGDTAEEIGRLKTEPGAEILAHGGTTFARCLVRLKLVDEYRLWVLPAAAGRGAQLFTGMEQPLRLTLAASTAFPSGILELVYTPSAGTPD